MLSFFGTFWTYLTWSVEFLLLRHPPLWVLTAVLIASLVAATVHQSSLRSDVWKRTYWIAIVQFLCLPATIAVGVVGNVDWQRVPFPGPNRLGIWTNNVLSLISLGLGIYLIGRMRGQRWFALSLTLLQWWLLFAAGLIAAMSLTATWP